MVLAATGDTWGIPGPTFITGYLVAAALLVVLATLHRTVLLGGGRDAFTAPMGPQQAAYLNGGPRLALYAALAGLRVSGAIGSEAHTGALTTTGPRPLGLTPLDNAVYDAAHRRVRTRDLGADPGVRSALDGLRAGLESAGWALTDGQRGTIRLWGVAALFLVGVGFLRLMAGLQNDRPVAFLVLALIAMVGTAVYLLTRVPVQTRAGRAAVRRLRGEQAHLAPALSPAYATYGAAGAAMGVALFGAASLWALDPAFAAQAEIQRQAAASGYSGSSGCGGGSSSSDSGGGSSCGGGGGCGGGCGG
ncbi:TIGR04222 domain-containing membrane protein [Spirilliplanes yamanashiensis]|uniref:TIGR04222 domain-containing membrane protein n=1 Tax=Spirilliplanes yamanashiensis TaxID=42233 RepID=A0A8J3Y836_9ACTN|nr:TIGR04222 domain-containing membrane protein [Spirilliplanes yamanashiensis]MDP9817117.1 uncharacterized protein (TIGR04222 family) [Spirilliplanes yamanashiensis]GIJ03229.1 hypothetical protein Sya03_25810 [Spirilliplanes yamanashiensis]